MTAIEIKMDHKRVQYIVPIKWVITIIFFFFFNYLLLVSNINNC